METIPITYDVDEEQNLVLVKVSGEFTDEIVLQFERDFIADRHVKPGFRALFDARAVRLTEVSEKTVGRLLEMEEADPEKFNRSRRALVFNEQLGWARAKKFEDSASGSVIVFYSMDVARMWLNIEGEWNTEQPGHS